jgi:hypothetical protein
MRLFFNKSLSVTQGGKLAGKITDTQARWTAAFLWPISLPLVVYAIIKWVYGTIQRKK